MLQPNSGRIIVELIRAGDKQGDIYLPTRENVKAGENLLIGKVIHPGDGEEVQIPYTQTPHDSSCPVNCWCTNYGKTRRVTKFKEGQLVMFQEYSMSGVYKDVQALVEGKVSASDSMKPENQYHVVAIADIMAYDA